MALPRDEFTFPTRSYPYRRGGGAVAADADPASEVALQPGQLYRFVLGLDPVPRPLVGDELNSLLRDPFAELLLKQGRFPLSLAELLATLDAVADQPAGLGEQQCFLVADGGQIVWTPATADLNRQLRFVVARARDGDTRLLVSSSTVVESTEQFLQLLAWDPDNAVYNFYERRAGTWLWAGNSRHALTNGTRGRGPFDSHVNGALVMKELRQPWNGWHSMSASIPDTVLAPDDPLRDLPLFRDRSSAHLLESNVIRPGIERWNRARVRAATASGDGKVTEVGTFMRQILETTTVNLTSSSQASSLVDDSVTLILPTTFFLNVDALLDSIGLAPNITPIGVPGKLYRESLNRYEFGLTDGAFRQSGDSFFAFLVPEPAFEDLDVLARLLRQNIISRRFAAALLMVDFANPIFSERRRQLLRYSPTTATRPAGAGAGDPTDLEAQFVAAVEASVPAPGSPEDEFLANWRLPVAIFERTFEARIEDYFAQLGALADTEAGFDGWVRLADSRRREFRRHRLFEFSLTVPTTNIPPDAPILQMRPDGTVQLRPTP
jgi:hypothetical protein